MSEENKTEDVEVKDQAAAGTEGDAPAKQEALSEVKLNGVFLKKLGMSSVFNEDGKNIPVTVLKLEKWNVTQVKTPESDGYSAVQVSLLDKAEKNTHKSNKGHLKASTKATKGALICKEIRQDIPEGIKLGLEVSWESLAKGDKVRMTATSKGRGFTGVMKRWNFRGGPATHGAGFHRRPGSIGNCTFPGRVMAGRKMPGHFGNETITVKNVEVVDVQTDTGLVLVKGAVPGARNGLVQLLKQQ